MHINVKQNEEIGSDCYSQFFLLFSSLTHFFLLMYYKVIMLYDSSSVRAPAVIERIHDAFGF